jgi:hypothetical protein
MLIHVSSVIWTRPWSVGARLRKDDWRTSDCRSTGLYPCWIRSSTKDLG